MQQHLYTVAMETRYNSTYTQWLVSPDASARTHSGWRAEIQQQSPTVAIVSGLGMTEDEPVVGIRARGPLGGAPSA